MQILCSSAAGSGGDSCGNQEAVCSEQYGSFGKDIGEAMWEVRNRVQKYEGDYISDASGAWSFPNQPYDEFTCKETGISVWNAIALFQVLKADIGAGAAFKEAVEALFPKCNGPGHFGDAMQHAGFSAFLAKEVKKKSGYTAADGAVIAKAFMNTREDCATDADGNPVSGAGAYDLLSTAGKLHYHMDINNNKVGADTLESMTSTDCFLWQCWENSPSRKNLWNKIVHKVENKHTLISDPDNIPGYSKNWMFIMDPNANIEEPAPPPESSPVHVQIDWDAVLGCIERDEIGQVNDREPAVSLDDDEVSDAATSDAADASNDGANPASGGRGLLAGGPSPDCYSPSGFPLSTLRPEDVIFREGIDFDTPKQEAAEGDWEVTMRPFDPRTDGKFMIDAVDACTAANARMTATSSVGDRPSGRALLAAAAAMTPCLKDGNVVYTQGPCARGTELPERDAAGDEALATLTQIQEADASGAFAALAADACAALTDPEAWCAAVLPAATKRGAKEVLRCVDAKSGAVSYASAKDGCARGAEETLRMASDAVAAQCAAAAPPPKRRKANRAGALSGAEAGVVGGIAAVALSAVVVAAMLRRRKKATASGIETTSDEEVANPAKVP